MFGLFPLVFGFPFVMPQPGSWRDRDDARNYSCAFMTVEQAQVARPGAVRPVGPRGDLYERDVVLCQERMLPLGLRLDADEAILSTLDARVKELAGAARSRRPDLEGATWLVEVYYPSPAVSAKIGFATKNALMAEGLGVSDRTPTLAAGDVQVITRMPPNEAYPTACRRYTDNGSLGANDALLAVVLLDRQETALHAGLCAAGSWTWLR